MKSANVILVFFFAVFAIKVSAQGFYQEENFDELQNLYDTLPDRPVISLFEGSIEENTSSLKQFKSAAIKGSAVSGLPSRYNRQLSSSRKNWLKSAELIKSLNQEASPYYLEKLDSVVEYEPTMVPEYDSVLVAGEKIMVKYNENGYVFEVVIDTIDTKTNSYLKKEKIEYTPDTEGNLLQQINYNWNGSSWVEITKRVKEFNTEGNITLDVTENWDGSDWINSNKTEMAYNEDGNRTLYATYRTDENHEWIGNYKYIDTYHENGEHATNNYFADWNPLEGMWTREGKTEYNEQGQRTVYYYKRYNTESKEWEYSYYIEYEYLEDESIVETRYGWNAETKELYQQYQNRYKYQKEYQGEKVIVEIKLNYADGIWVYGSKIEREYDGDKLMQEVRSYFSNNTWEEDYRKIYEYDKWGNQILYEIYDADWWGEITQREVQAFDEKGQRIKYELCRWEYDDEYGWFKKIGVRFDEFIRDSDGRILSNIIYKWNEDREVWEIDWKWQQSYPKDGEQIREKYILNVKDYYAVFKRSYFSILTYNDTIGKYTGIKEGGYDYETRVKYNDNLKVDEILVIDEGILENKIKCYYDASGRDTAWYEYEWGAGKWELDWKVTFSYQDLGGGQNIISEQWSFGNLEKNYTDNYFEDGKLMKVVDVSSVWENNEWVTREEDITKYNYNAEGQITLIIDESGDYQWKEEYNFSDDTLTVNEYFRYVGDANPVTVAWSLDDKSVYLVDPGISKSQFQNIPAAFIGDIMSSYNWHSIYDYGKILEVINYYRGYESEEFELSYKTIYFYSPASRLQGEAIISGYIFEETGADKTVSTSTQLNGNPAPRVAVSLCVKEDNLVLGTVLTDAYGYYEFKGVPAGIFYLKIDLEGFEQTSTYDIPVTKDSNTINNKNFIVNGELVLSGIPEYESVIRIYPNPASNRITVKANEEIKALRIWDINGRTKMYLKELNSTFVNLSIEKIEAGLYVFEVTTTSSICNKKIIIKD